MDNIEKILSSIYLGDRFCENVTMKDDKISFQIDCISRLLASGYLKVLWYECLELVGDRPTVYDLALTNYEVKRMFFEMMQSWFGNAGENYNDFIDALLRDAVEEINVCMNRITRDVFSYFNTTKEPSESVLIAKGFARKSIKKYGFVFQGKMY